MGMRVVKNVTNEGELVACVARNGDTEVELSLAEPTRGSLLLLFCQERQQCGRLVCATGSGSSGISMAISGGDGLEGQFGDLLSLSSGAAQRPRGLHRSLRRAVLRLALIFGRLGRHRRWGSAGVLDFNVPHVSSLPLLASSRSLEWLEWLPNDQAQGADRSNLRCF
jgi:hypothetical protein